jgi:hypothetical protein
MDTGDNEECNGDDIDGKLSDRNRKLTQAAKYQQRRSKYCPLDNTNAARTAYRRDDGNEEPDNLVDDVTPEILERIKRSFYESNVVVTVYEAERKTRDQCNSELWRNERRKRLTASSIGTTAKMKKDTKRSNRVKELLYSKFHGNSATNYGLEMEESCRMACADYLKQSTGSVEVAMSNCGMFISVNEPWIAASPDGKIKVGDTVGLVENKNPHAVKDQTIMEACDIKLFCLKQDKKKQKELTLKQKHNYYYQVQCQLYCTGWIGVICC